MIVPTVPFYGRALCVDQGSLQDLAAQRDLPLCQQQPRDDQGQFKSHRDIPNDTRQDY